MIRGSVINPTTMSFGGVGNDCYKSRARSLLCTLQTSVNGHMKIINIQYSVPAIDAIKNNTAKKVKECLRKSAHPILIGRAYGQTTICPEVRTVQVSKYRSTKVQSETFLY